MNEQEITRRVEQAFKDGSSIDLAMTRAGQRAFQYHAWTNTKLRIWRDGQVVELDPQDKSAQLPEGFVKPKNGTPPWVGL